MAEGFEPYHGPQQSRRDKLRFLPGQPHPVCEEPGPHHLHGCATAASFYDPTSISLLSSSDLLTCADSSVKEEGHVNLMGYMNNSSSASSSLHNFRNPYLDPQPSNLAANTNSVNDINGLNNLFMYPSQQSHHHLREFNNNEPAALFRPEPLSLSLSSQPVEVQSLQRYGYSGIGDGGQGSRSPGPTPLGPFTGYASILKGSRFLKPAQQLLEEFCDVGSSSRDIYAAVSRIMTDESSSFLDDPPIESLDDPASVGGGDGGESRRKKSRLLSMLDEVYRRYKQYYNQMQAVVNSFEYVAGLGNAAPYANLAIKAMTRHFKCLKNAITDQLQYSRSGRDASTYVRRNKDETIPMLRDSTRGMYGQPRSFQSTDFVEPQPVWRPQRGLPERAVSVLRSWLFEHFLHPYPTDTDKITLAKQTGLSRNQVSNWFINARVRLWKPMVEEIHMLETRQAHIASQKVGDRNADKSDDHDHLPSTKSVASDNPSTSTYRAQDTASKRPRNEFPDVTVASTTHQQLNMSYNNLSSHLHHVGHVGGSMAGGTTSGVSLTLGLHHQNNGIVMSEPPYAIINTAQRFGLGLEGNSDGYPMGGFDAQSGHFGRDVMGRQLLRDFVG
ncbi:BEL1-like homeodomain protein 9 [Argentina anserina]|uniref:BEL1-like homeodomain protein 9 n=1 Tax=Argentina anserina TaxID=57926 RepID=UPI002176670C|nr:BEL1-like homeodomain protein 9 [Potentilla anserina]